MPENGSSDSGGVGSGDASRAPLLEGSRLWGLWRRLRPDAGTLSAWYRNAALGAVGETLSTAWDRSRVRRWFLAEPDPSVVALDLRETVTFGTLFSLLDRTSRSLDESRVARIGSHLDRTRDVISDAPVRIASGLGLGVLVGRFLATWPALSDGEVGRYALLAAVLLVGIRIETVLETVANSRFGERATALLAPSESRDDASR